MHPLLGYFGADVVKIERPEAGDVNRHWDSAVQGDSSVHVWINRNERSLELTRCIHSQTPADLADGQQARFSFWDAVTNTNVSTSSSVEYLTPPVSTGCEVRKTLSHYTGNRDLGR